MSVLDDAFDTRDFRRALGQFPTGVTVITTLDSEGRPVGVTASSFNSLSLDPPLVLWSVDKSALSADTFRNARHFAVNVLSREQMDLSNRFASRGEDKFRDVDWRPGLGGCPLFRDVSAHFECRSWASYEGGDHWILVGEVKTYSHKAELAPLVFAQGGYAVSAVHPAKAA